MSCNCNDEMTLACCCPEHGVRHPERLGIEAMAEALLPLAAIADAFEADALDEARPEWRDEGHGADGSEPEKVGLLFGRGGATLLTLADAFAARAALRNEPWPPVSAPAPTVPPPAESSSDDWRQRVTAAIEKIHNALLAHVVGSSQEAEALTAAREAVAALRPQPLVKGAPLKVFYQDKWHEGVILEEQDAFWRVEIPTKLQPLVLTVWKANNSSWRRG